MPDRPECLQSLIYRDGFAPTPVELDDFIRTSLGHGWTIERSEGDRVVTWIARPDADPGEPVTTWRDASMGVSVFVHATAPVSRDVANHLAFLILKRWPEGWESTA